MAPQMIISNNDGDGDGDDSLYDLTSTITAPTTPTTRHYNTNTSPLHFYSVPTSPLPTFNQTDPPTPKSFTYYDDDDFEDANNNFIEFEFGTSHRFTPDDFHDFYQMGLGFESSYHQNKKDQQEPAMAFADELFCDGKVMPLKPPPRLQNGNDSSFCLSSPRSPTTAALKFPFPRRSLWNDDFDPFMVALENVKDDEKRSKKSAKEHRRTASMSPLRAISPKMPSKSISFHHPETKNQIEPNGPHSIWVPHKNKKIESLGGESKGVLFARHTRTVMTESEESPSSTRKSKRQRIKKLILRSVSSMGRATATNEDKNKDCYQSEAPPQPQPQPQPQPKPLPTKKKSFARKFSFMSKGGGSDIAQCNEEKRVVSQVTKVTQMQYRPRLFVCMGHGAAKYVN